MFICNNCKNQFDEPKTKTTSYEAEYGVGNLFPSSTRWDLQVCPLCGSDDIEELTMCRCCHEWVKEEELERIEGIENLDFVCPECLEIYGEQKEAE